MSERKVLNKYYPPDFDPSKIPRLKNKSKQHKVRTMAPCNMRCNTCGDYIAKARKFNARKETVEDESYMGLLVYRFYIKCPKCMAEITFKTDPKETDYVVEQGATQNFMALKMAEKQAEEKAVAEEEEEKINPMKHLENRTNASKNEMEVSEQIQTLRMINQRQINVDYDSLIANKRNEEAAEIKKQEDEDVLLAKAIASNQETVIYQPGLDLNDAKVEHDEIIEEEQFAGLIRVEPKVRPSHSDNGSKPRAIKRLKLSGVTIKAKNINADLPPQELKADCPSSSSNHDVNPKPVLDQVRRLCDYSDSDSE